MNYLKKVLGQTAIYGISSIVARVLNYLLIPYYTRVFTPSEYGIVTDLYSLATIFAVVLAYGMETSFFRFINKYPENKNKIINTSFTILLISSSLFMILGISLQHSLAKATGYENNIEYLLYFILILGLDAFLIIPFSHLRQEGRALKFTTIKTLNILINIFFNIFFLVVVPFVVNNYNISFSWFNGVSVKYIFISNLLSTSITFLIFSSYFLKIKLALDLKILKKMLLYGFPILIAGLSGVINESMDKQFLKYLLPKETALKEIGIYGASYKITIFMTLFIQSFRMGIEPFFFQKSKDSDAKEIYAKIMNYFIAFLCIIYLFITTNIDIVKYFIGEEYREGLKIVPIVLLANLFLGIYTNLSVWYKVIDKTIFGAIFSIVGVFFTVIINILFIPKYGYMASAWATFFAYFFMTVFSYLVGQKLYKINYKIFHYLLYIITSVGFSLITMYLNKNIFIIIIFNIVFILLTLYLSMKSFFKNGNKSR